MPNPLLKFQCLSNPAFATKKSTIISIKKECANQGINLANQISYVLATVHHETNNTFKPVKEAYWLKDPDAYLKKHHADYYPYYGRGYVQLTWKSNYEYYGKLLEIDLVTYPDLLFEPEIALFILVHGFRTGKFTGRKLADYVSATKTDFFHARRCINKLDRAEDIVKLAETYLQEALQNERHISPDDNFSPIRFI